ncbi:hypothetical protein RQN9TF_06325 [Rhodococcus qingshengii]|nr:hypothetical protein RHOER0001_3926 [Rhodococcus erythropolis SK121]MBP2521243.1 hypothetical protein [Rhodococcus sp. PvP104]BCF81690.1 hypothetical protein RQCS_12350 [Rhodococcus qingshengii]BDQ18801.1 hypothetical protein RQN9TF_06325 [Rhodococcus qingshengii]
MNHMTVTTEHLRALLGSGPHSELVAVGGEIEIYVPDEEGFGLEGISLVTREQLAERLPSSPDNPDEGELRIAAESLSEMIAELGG